MRIDVVVITLSFISWSILSRIIYDRYLFTEYNAEGVGTQVLNVHGVEIEGYNHAI